MHLLFLRSAERTLLIYTILDRLGLPVHFVLALGIAGAMWTNVLELATAQARRQTSGGISEIEVGDSGQMQRF